MKKTQTLIILLAEKGLKGGVVWLFEHIESAGETVSEGDGRDAKRPFLTIQC